MQIKTARFGELQIKNEDVYSFPRGIPGFDELKEYVIVSIEENEPFSFLQSVRDGEVAFLIADPFLFYPDYDFDLPDAAAAELRIESAEQLFIRSMISLRSDLGGSTINLVAPLVFNSAARLGRQVVLGKSPYTPKHPLFAAAHNR